MTQTPLQKKARGGNRVLLTIIIFLVVLTAGSFVGWRALGDSLRNDLIGPVDSSNYQPPAEDMNARPYLMYMRVRRLNDRVKLLEAEIVVMKATLAELELHCPGSVR